MIVGRTCAVDGLAARGYLSPQAVPIGRGDRHERGGEGEGGKDGRVGR